VTTTIAINSLSKTYPAIGKAGLTRAVDSVDLTIEPGELFFLLGPSGCGKTTLLRMIAGFIDPSNGSICFNEKNVTTVAPNKRNTGMVFQSYALWPHMTVAQNVAFGLGIRKVPQDKRTRQVHDALAQVQMEAYADRKPTQLSGGQQQRVALARALVVRPDVLLLDEPLSNLDARLRLDLRSQIRKICKNAGLSTLYVTHDQKEALSMADRIAIMQAGKVMQVGTPAELYRSPSSRFVAEFLGQADLFPATCKESSPDILTLDTPAGTILAAPASSSRKPIAAGAKVTVCVRPESWKLVRESAAHALAGIVQSIIYLGELTQIQIKLNPHDPHDDTPRPGTPAPPSEPAPCTVLMSLLNAPPATLPGVGELIHATVEPSDVILLPVVS